MTKSASDKVKDLADSTLDAALALIALFIDSGFWFGWAYLTRWSNARIGALGIQGFEVLPYRFGQWCGCGLLAFFVLFRSIKDLISLWDSFADFWNERKISRH